MSTDLLVGLVDDAGLFPPEELAMGPALQRHAADVAAAHPVWSQRFVCPVSRVGEALSALGPAETLHLSLVADTGVEGIEPAVALVRSDSRLTLAAIECRLQPAHLREAGPVLLAAVPADVRLWLETGWGDDSAAALDVLAGLDARAGGARVGAKVRCGGDRQDLFPSSAALAGAIAGCAQRGLAWKATAGLHRPVRYRDPATGLRHHGYLNLLLAAARAASSAERGATGVRGPAGADGVDLADGADLVAILDRCATGDLVAAALALDPTQVAAARAAFVSYGSCSTAEPVAEATRLGLVPALAS